MITDVESPATLLCYVSQLLKRSVPENFQQGNFLGLVPTESLRTQDSENIIGLGDQVSILNSALNHPLTFKA